MAMVELVDYNEIYNPNSKKVKKTTRRGRSKKADDTQVEETSTEEKSEE
jgi:large subunit ribosomal protein L17